MNLKLGIDVGGTNTDAVLVDENLQVIAETKRPTTADIYSGIIEAVRSVLDVSGVDRRLIRQAMLGTTQCTNAIIERKNLAQVGALRIGAPAAQGIPPMIDWAPDLCRIAAATATVRGGFEYDGKELMPFDEAAARAFFTANKGKVQAVAISCVFATIRNDHELAAARLCHEIMGDALPVSLSSEIGSIVRAQDGQVTVGPDSVGYAITRDALVFGGTVLTATDIAVRLGMVDIGDKSRVAGLDEALAKRALQVMVEHVEDSIDAIKITSDDIDVILVGGGSIILPAALRGAQSVYVPLHFGTANAIGSAISKVSGTYEKLVSYDKTPREEALDAARQEAIQMAVDAGAVRESVEIIDVEDVPLAYYPGNTSRVKIKAAGNLA